MIQYLLHFYIVYNCESAILAGETVSEHSSNTIGGICNILDESDYIETFNQYFMHPSLSSFINITNDKDILSFEHYPKNKNCSALYIRALYYIYKSLFYKDSRTVIKAIQQLSEELQNHCKVSLKEEEGIKGKKELHSKFERQINFLNHELQTIIKLESFLQDNEVLNLHDYFINPSNEFVPGITFIDKQHKESKDISKLNPYFVITDFF